MSLERADLEGAGEVTVHHVSEALLFRSLDAFGHDTGTHPDRYHRPRESRPGSPVH